MITKPIIPLFVVIPVLLILLVLYAIRVYKKDDKLIFKILTMLRIIIIAVLIFLVNLRIMDKKYDSTIEMKNLDVLFVVDTTISMWAQDYDGNDPRMEGVLKDAEYIIDELSGSNFGLIRFDNRGQILAPFTQDHETVKDAFSTIKMPDRYYAKGSSLNNSYDEMKSLLDSSNQKKERMTVLFFISDGEITDGSTLMSFKELEPLIDTGAVLGYGTDKGGRMKDTYGGYMYDSETGGDALSVIDENNLKAIANEMDIEYIHMKSTANVKYLVESIKNGSSLTVEKADSVSYEDTYYKYAIALLIFLALEIVLFIRRGRL
ncbi:MAG: VWA domain-containing protein [Eubacterium sp.]|nr:VWA domain-containing protein [Eubacterium sp.]